MLRTVEIENRTFVITSLTKDATVLPLLCLEIVCEPFRNFGINPVIFGKSGLDKPRGPSPGLTGDAVLQE